MILGFIGKMGSGKTLSMTKYAKEYFDQGCKIYSNYNLNFKHEKIDIKKLLTMDDDLQNAVILLDEIHIFIDSRESMRKKNRLISYFITQSRKRNLILMFTTQQMHQIDKRLRTNCNYFIMCSKKQVGSEAYIRNMIVSEDDKRRVTFVKASDYYDLYNTKQIIDFTEGLENKESGGEKWF